MSVLSPSMGLVVSTVGIDSGLNWETNLNSSLAILDGHNHTSGSGVPIPPAGLNINTALSFNNQQATNMQAVLFTNQSSLATVNALYVIAGELWFNDPTQPVQITSGGAVAVSSSGITGSGGASAAFSTGVLVVNSAANTPANIQCGSVLMGNVSAGSNFITVGPPASLAASYSFTLPPAVPAAQSFMAIDSSGNVTAYAAVSGGLTHTNLSSSAGITGGQIAATTISASNIVNATITTTQISGTAGITNGQLAGANFAESSACGSYSPATTSYTTITNLSVTLTATGSRLIYVAMVSDGNVSTIECGSSPSDLNYALGDIQIVRDIGTGSATTIAQFGYGLTNNGSISAGVSPAPYHIDTGASAGSHTYTAQAKIALSSGSMLINNWRLIAYEM